MAYALCLVPCVLCLVPRASWLMPHAPCLCLVPRASCGALGEKYLKKMKLVSTLSREGMSPEAFKQLPADMRVAVWQRSNETMYGLIMDSLGHKYRHLMGRVAEGDGLGAYNAILLLDNEHTAGAKNQYLTS